MKRETASKIATDLIEGGINARMTVRLTAQAHHVNIEQVRAIKRVLLKGGKENMLSYADAIDNGWEDAALNLEK
jgi:hypothetical protein